MSTQHTLTCIAPVLPALSDYSFHPRRDLAVMVTPRTHCHFVIRHVRYAFLKFVLTTPLLHAWLRTFLPRRSIGFCSCWCSLTHGSHRRARWTFPACALHQLFVRLCDLAHDGLYCSHVCACTHRSLLLHLSLVFAFVSFCSQMEEHQNVQPATGTTEWNHSYFRGNSTLCTTLSPTVT